MQHYIAVYKPYMMLCQFTPEQAGDVTLANLDVPLPIDVYAVGRLDKDSEGLLLLTNDNYLKNRILDPKFKHQKTYWVQVEGNPTLESIEALRRGVTININGKSHLTLPAKISILDENPMLPERNPPIRYRAAIPTSWLSITIYEGKNRQVRRMCAKVGFPVLRLVRTSMQSLDLARLGDTNISFFEKKEIYKLLQIS